MAKSSQVPEPDKSLPAAPQSTAVANWESELSALAQQTVETEKPAGNWISFKGGQLSFGGQPIPGAKLPVVVIYSVFENQLYQDKYDPNNPQPPICYALAENDEELKPHPEAYKPQAESCEVCPHNAWGSDPSGGRGKACKNVRRLAMVAAADLDKLDKAEIGLAKMPVTSVKNWSSYASQIANVLKVPPLAVITEMSVTPDPKTQFQVNFQLIDKITDPKVLQDLLKKRGESHQLVYMPYDKPTERTAQVAAAATRKF